MSSRLSIEIDDSLGPRNWPTFIMCGFSAEILLKSSFGHPRQEIHL
jgi:hypothetical protein